MLVDNMKQVHLNKGMVCRVDDEDYEFVSKWTWFAYRSPKTHIWYARRTTHDNGKVGFVLMHRLLTGARSSTRVDHKDGDGLNNQRSNLRLATVSQNGMNRHPNRTNGTGVKGVYESRLKNGVVRYHAHVVCNRKNYYLGTFTDMQSAAVAYNRKAMELFGEFARLNSVIV